METDIKKELEELAKVQAEPVKEISEEAANDLDEQDTRELHGDIPEAVPISVGLGSFAGAITNIYCNISDLLYKRIKKSESAPEWPEDLKEQITAQVAVLLETYKIPVTNPIYGLLVTIAVAEIMRYTNKSLVI